MTAPSSVRFRTIAGHLRKPGVPVFVAVAGILAVLAFTYGAIAGGNDPSSGIGMTLGAGATLAIIAVMAHSFRRSRPHVRSLGPARTYYEVHVWCGSLFFVLLLLHTDFRLPRSTFGLLLWAASLWVVATGALGWFLQWLIPRTLVATSAFEANYERIPEMMAELRARGEETAAHAEQRIRNYYDAQLAPALVGPRMSLAALIGSRADRGGALELLQRTVVDQNRVALDALTQIHATKLDLDRQFTLQRVLRGWLLVHLPVACVLIVAVVLHILLITYF